MVMDLFHQKLNLEEINHTFIPKLENPVMVHQYRSISLYSVSYKIISKILVRRLQPIMKKLISTDQSAFVDSRLTSDNILIGRELLHDFQCRKGKQIHMFIKLDMNKAYDQLEWDYIEVVRDKFAFANK